MSLYPTEFPVDLTGKAERNKVTNEVRTFANHSERIFVPSGGPFFTGSLRVIDSKTGLELAPITQYTALHLQTDATLDSGSQVCCVIVINDITVSGVTLTYQVVGGRYSRVVETLIDLMQDLNWDTIGKISWGSQVYGKPEVFPAAAHKHPGGEFGDWKRFHMALNNIYQAMIHKDRGAWLAVYDFMTRTIDVAIDAAVAKYKVDTSKYFTKTEVTQQINTAISNIPVQTPVTQQMKVSTTAGNEILLKTDGVFYNGRVNVKTVTSSYTPTTTELASSLLLRVDSTASTTTVTIGKVSTSVVIGSVVHIRQINKAVKIAAASGVTISPSDSLDMRRTGITATLVYIGSEKWDLITELD